MYNCIYDLTIYDFLHRFAQQVLKLGPIYLSILLFDYLWGGGVD